MPKLNHVKAARKDYPREGIAKGDSYYYWEFRTGGVIRSKTHPKPSQLTQSEFLSTIYGITEDLETLSADTYVSEEEGKIVIDHSGLESAIGDAVANLETLRDETQDKHDNMPDSLQDGPTGELLQNRVDSVSEMIDTLEGIDLGEAENFDEEEDEEVEAASETLIDVADAALAKLETRRERATEIVQAIIDEIQGVSFDGE
jgi:hypothetical protein